MMEVEMEMEMEVEVEMLYQSIRNMHFVVWLALAAYYCGNYRVIMNFGNIDRISPK